MRGPPRASSRRLSRPLDRDPTDRGGSTSSRRIWPRAPPAATACCRTVLGQRTHQPSRSCPRAGRVPDPRPSATASEEPETALAVGSSARIEGLGKLRRNGSTSSIGSSIREGSLGVPRHQEHVGALLPCRGDHLPAAGCPLLYGSAQERQLRVLIGGQPDLFFVVAPLPRGWCAASPGRAGAGPSGPAPRTAAGGSCSANCPLLTLCWKAGVCAGPPLWVVGTCA